MSMIIAKKKGWSAIRFLKPIGQYKYSTNAQEHYGVKGHVGPTSTELKDPVALQMFTNDFAKAALENDKPTLVAPQTRLRGVLSKCDIEGLASTFMSDLEKFTPEAYKKISNNSVEITEITPICHVITSDVFTHLPQITIGINSSIVNESNSTKGFSHLFRNLVFGDSLASTKIGFIRNSELMNIYPTSQITKDMITVSSNCFYENFEKVLNVLLCQIGVHSPNPHDVDNAIGHVTNEIKYLGQCRHFHFMDSLHQTLIKGPYGKSIMVDIHSYDNLKYGSYINWSLSLLKKPLVFVGVGIPHKVMVNEVQKLVERYNLFLNSTSKERGDAPTAIFRKNRNDEVELTIADDRLMHAAVFAVPTKDAKDLSDKILYEILERKIKSIPDTMAFCYGYRGISLVGIVLDTKSPEKNSKIEEIDSILADLPNFCKEKWLLEESINKMLYKKALQLENSQVYGLELARDFFIYGEPFSLESYRTKLSNIEPSSLTDFALKVTNNASYYTVY